MKKTIVVGLVLLFVGCGKESAQSVAQTGGCVGLGLTNKYGYSSGNGAVLNFPTTVSGVALNDDCSFIIDASLYIANTQPGCREYGVYSPQTSASGQVTVTSVAGNCPDVAGDKLSVSFSGSSPITVTAIKN